MTQNIKPLIAVLIAALPALLMIRQLCSPFTTTAEFAVWRNAWLAATIAAFLLGSFTFFAVAMMVICAYCHARNATSPALFFVLLFAAPLVNIPIPGFGGINLLFSINNGRLLSMVLLAPLLFAARGLHRQIVRSYTLPDLLVVTYVVLLTVLQFRNSDITNVARVGFTNVLDILIPYFAFSRINLRAEDIGKSMAAYVFALLPLCFVSIIEVLKRWHPYGVVFLDWGLSLQYIEREGVLRAVATSSGANALGYIIMVSMGCLISLWQPLKVWDRYAKATLLVMAAGLIAAFSRGSWIGALALVVVFVGTGRKAATNLVKMSIVALFAVLLLVLSGYGEKVASFLPFIGSVEEFNVTYRQRLFTNSMEVIERNLWFGSADYLNEPEMRELIQGEGIIDTVNSFLEVALEAGVIGLSLFVAFFATVMLELYRTACRRFTKERSKLNWYARGCLSILVGILITIGTTSSIDYVPFIYWSFGGISVALVRLARVDALSLRVPAAPPEVAQYDFHAPV